MPRDLGVLRVKWSGPAELRVHTRVSIPLGEKVSVQVPDLPDSAQVFVEAVLKPLPGPRPQSAQGISAAPVSISSLLAQSDPTIRFEADEKLWKRMGLLRP